MLGDQLAEGLGLPRFAECGANFVVGEVAVLVGVDHVVEALFDWAFVALVDQGLVLGFFVVGQTAQGVEVVGQSPFGRFAIFDEVVALPLPRAVAGGEWVLLDHPAADRLLLFVAE